MTPPTRHRSRCAFTLIEIMVAIVIFSMVMAAIYSVWMAIIRSTQVAQKVAAQAQRERVGLRTIEDAIEGIQSFQASPQYYSFVVDNEGETATLSFTAQVPEEMFPRNGKFNIDLRRLTFSVESDQSGTKNLVLRQNPVLMDMDEDEQKYPLELVKNVHEFSIECWGTNQQTGKIGWLDEWSDTNAIPQMLRVRLVMGVTTADGSAAPDVSIARVYSVPSQMMPAILQRGGSAGTPAPGGAPTLNPAQQ